jgi:hypothetical protein
MSLDHLERIRWVDEIAKINKRMNDQLKEEMEAPWR